MDVPSREEFEKQQALLEALCRYLKLTYTTCGSHSDFKSRIEKAIRYCDEIQGLDCQECGASYRERYPVVFSPE